MVKNLILRTQANEIIEDIKAIGLDPAEFQWEEVNSRKTHGLRVSRLTHRPSGYYFVFDYEPRGGHCGECSPGAYSGHSTFESKSWDEQLTMVEAWILLLNREVTSPDLWAAFYQETRLSEAASACDIAEQPFSIDEQKQIATSLNEIKEYVIATHELQGEQVTFVIRQFRYLTDATKRVGRKDWLNIANSVMISTGLHLALKSDAIRDLFRFATHALNHLIGGGILPTP